MIKILFQPLFFSAYSNASTTPGGDRRTQERKMPQNQFVFGKLTTTTNNTRVGPEGGTRSAVSFVKSDIKIIHFVALATGVRARALPSPVGVLGLERERGREREICMADQGLAVSCRWVEWANRK